MSYERLTKRNEYGMAYVPNNDVGDMAILKALEKLAGLEDKIENGTLVDLPCRVGDTIYFIHDREDIMLHRYFVKKSVVTNIVLCLDGNIEIWISRRKRFAVDSEDIGKIIFFTREEAEAKLKELKLKSERN